MRGTLTSLSIACAFALTAPGAAASNPYLELVPKSEAQASPAYRYANLSDDAARSELVRRRIPHALVTRDVPGVRAPVRLTGPLHGVRIHSSLPEEQRGTTPYEILDARLALSLDDLCTILSTHDVVELVHFTMYRPPSTRAGASYPKATRHPGGLAIDLGALRKADGTWLSVGPHWPAGIGQRTCGASARHLAPRRGRELRSILCEANDQRLFHYMLSPHFDEDHEDHLHLEIKPNTVWFLAN